MLDKIITKWWFYVICILVFFVPSIVQIPVAPENISLVVQEVMQKGLIYKMSFLFPIAKALLLFLLIGGLIWKNKFTKVFAILISIQYAFIMIFQNISLETTYGYAILLGNIILQSVVIVSWIYEINRCENNFSIRRLRWWNIVIFIFALIAFLMPELNGKMNFSINNMIYNEAGLTYCMVTPIILSIMLLYYPYVNKVTLRITSFVGLLFGIINIITWFVLNTSFWWMGIVHFPLLLISFIGLLLSKRMKRQNF